MTLKRAGPPGSNDPMLFGGLPLQRGTAAAVPTRCEPAALPARLRGRLPVHHAGRHDVPGAVPGADAQGAAGRHGRPDGARPARGCARANAPPGGGHHERAHARARRQPAGRGRQRVPDDVRPKDSYRTRVVIPPNHQPGVDWYHAHRHGYTADQVYGGLAGILQIGDPLDPGRSTRASTRSGYLDLTLGLISADPATGNRYLANPRASRAVSSPLTAPRGASTSTGSSIRRSRSGPARPRSGRSPA